MLKVDTHYVKAICVFNINDTFSFYNVKANLLNYL